MATAKIQTTEGDIVVKLYDDTPLHRDNFIKLAKEGFYDGTLFHRVIKDFMIQGGDPDSRNATKNQQLGTGGPGYTIPAEISSQYIHKRGALAAARQSDEVNPERASSGSQFYIVWGQKYNQGQMAQLSKQMQMQAEQSYFNSLVGQHRKEIMDLRRNRDHEGLMKLQDQLVEQTKKQMKEHPVALSKEQIETYTTIGGTPFLDLQYTVFGEVLEGLDIVEQIQNVPTSGSDRPIEDVKILSIEITA